MVRFRVISNGKTGDCGPEQIYGESQPPEFDRRDDAEQAAAELLPGARSVAPRVAFMIEEIED